MRDPFDYPTYCTGPDMSGIVLDIEALLDPPLCTITRPTSATADPVPNFWIPEILYSF